MAYLSETEAKNLENMCIPSNTKALLELSKCIVTSPNKNVKKAFSILSYCLTIDIDERPVYYTIYFKTLGKYYNNRLLVMF